MCDALIRRGMKVSLLEQAPAALTTVDPELGALVAEDLAAHGVRCAFGVKVTGIEHSGDTLIVNAEGGISAEGEIVLVLAGVVPDTRLAREAGARLGVRRAIAVDRQMWTGLPDIWAAGDCVQTHQQLLDIPSYMPLGSTAHKQGRVAGENTIGGSAEFAGSLGTQAVKVFDLVIAGTGLRETAARAEGFEALTVQTVADDHKAYYPGRARVAYSDRRGSRTRAAARRADPRARQRTGVQADRHARDRDLPPHNRRRGLRPRPQLHPAAVLALGPGPDRLPSLGTRPSRITSPSAVHHYDQGARVSITEPNPTITTTKRIELFEGAMCCETGVCGPSVDQQLITVRDDLRWAEARGASVARHNLTSDPDAFVSNPKVTSLMQAFGEKALPVLVIDGEIRAHGSYPTRDQLAALLAYEEPAAAAPAAAKSSGCGCAPGSGC
jgi:Arsenical resistance operon protein ArsD/Pyridine nucleotide-disulphide oxidoreductase